MFANNGNEGDAPFSSALLQTVCKCFAILFLAILSILKITVLAASSQFEFASCNVEFIFVFIRVTTIISIILLLTILLILCLSYTSAVEDEQIVLHMQWFLNVRGGCALAIFIFMVYNFVQHPEDTVMFYNTFYTNPTFPSNCTSAEKRVFVELGIALLKFDTFVFMLLQLIALCLCFCLPCCGTCLVGTVAAAFFGSDKENTSAYGLSVPNSRF